MGIVVGAAAVVTLATVAAFPAQLVVRIDAIPAAYVGKSATTQALHASALA